MGLRGHGLGGGLGDAGAKTGGEDLGLLEGAAGVSGRSDGATGLRDYADEIIVTLSRQLGWSHFV